MSTLGRQDILLNDVVLETSSSISLQRNKMVSVRFSFSTTPLQSLFDPWSPFYQYPVTTRLTRQVLQLLRALIYQLPHLHSPITSSEQCHGPIKSSEKCQGPAFPIRLHRSGYRNAAAHFSVFSKLLHLHPVTITILQCPDTQPWLIQAAIRNKYLETGHGPGRKAAPVKPWLSLLKIDQPIYKSSWRKGARS